MKRVLVVATVFSVLTVAGSIFNSCRKNDDGVGFSSSRAYKGHENDSDMNTFAATYPAIIGTRLDDCQTCHAGGAVERSRSVTTLNPCSYCHLIPHPDSGIISGAPITYQDTLNLYGLAYKDAGRSSVALRTIENLDSDGDTYSNVDEITAVRYPGDPASMPGQPTAPIYTFTWAAIVALQSHTEFLLMNTSKQQFDDYANYCGVKVRDLLAAAGVDLTGATGITVIAPDGFMKDFTLDNVNLQYPDGLYFPGLDPGSFSDPNQGFVNYPPSNQIPPGIGFGDTIPDEQWLLIAYRRDGLEMEESVLDPVTGKINGEGPYRIIVPQSTPGSPDRGSSYSPSGYADGWDYDPSKDHNAGNSVRGVVAIRVNPMPAGYEEFDWKNGGWSLIADRKIIIYGTGVTGN